MNINEEDMKKIKNSSDYQGIWKVGDSTYSEYTGGSKEQGYSDSSSKGWKFDPKKYGFDSSNDTDNKKKSVEPIREVDEDNYIVITIDKLKEQFGKETMLKKLKKSSVGNWPTTCLNCGFKDIFSEFIGIKTYTNNSGIGQKVLSCPNCGSKLIGLPKDREELLMKEILKGKEDEQD